MPRTDKDCIRLCLDGQPEAFRHLVRRHEARVLSYLTILLGDPEDASEAAQETFVRAYFALTSLRKPESFSAWLVGIARQVCREWRRGRLRERAGLERWVGDAGFRDVAETEQRPDDRIACLRNAIASLPDKERLALHAFYLQEQDAEQARSVVGLSRSGLYRVLAIARQRLERVLSKQEASS